MSRLFIAEKPSLARAIIDVLPKPHKKEEGFYRSADGDVVSWCIGHLLEQATPDAYDPRYKRWNLADLPIIPEIWKLTPKKNTAKQLTVLKRLIAKHDQIVHVGDPDREGQLLIDEVFNFCEIPKNKKDAIKRCLISDLNPSAVKKSLSQLKENREFIPLSTSALARARADWLYGINMSRLCTIRGQQTGYKGVLSVGRVQTPVLGLVVRRDLEIENFVSKPFYELFALVETKEGEQFKAKWQPSEACAPYQDDERRVLSLKLVENVAERIAGKEALINNVIQKKRKTPPPLVFNLSQLQIEIAKRFGLSAQEVLDICQRLYEKHKVITYPRSDCRYLPEEHFLQRQEVINAIKINAQLNEEELALDLSLKSAVWNDKRVEAHHGIIPTSKKLNPNALSYQERQVYDVIAKQYLMQFYEDYQYLELQIDVIIEGGLFIARAKKMLNPGWQTLLNRKESAEIDNSKEGDEPELLLNKMVTKGEICLCLNGDISSKETTPPKYFSDATLLAAMTGIARFMTDPELKKILRETDGIGTEATRAGIIELLFKRNYLERKGRTIRSTQIAKQLIFSLPEVMTTPDMTAIWEQQLNLMSQKKQTYHLFMAHLNQQLSELIQGLKFNLFSER